MRLRKNLRIWAALLLCACLIFLCGFTVKKGVEVSGKPEPPIIEIQPPEPLTEAPVETTGESNQPKFPRPVIDSGVVDDSIFENTAIIGNSCIKALEVYGLIKQADFYAEVGMTVQSAPKYIDPATNAPLVQAVTSKPYQRVLLMFGENELGWPYPENFIRIYREMVEQLQAGLPDAEFYIIAISPVGRAVSEKGKDGVTMEHAIQFNGLLETMAKEIGAVVLNSDSVLLDESTGYLKEEASSDGVHLNLDYCKRWTNNMIELIGRNEGLWKAE